MPHRLFEVTAAYLYMGQECVNRWNYLTNVVGSTDNMSAALLGKLGFMNNDTPMSETFGESLRNLLSTACTMIDVTCRDVYSDFDFVEMVQNWTGGTTGEGYSPVMAYGFSTNRTRLDIRQGTKRIPGAAEGAVSAGGVLSGNGITLTNDMAVNMSLPHTHNFAGTDITFQPAIVGKLKYRTNPIEEPVAKWAYKYNPDEAAQVAKCSVGFTWAPYPTLRSQVSRQLGRGR